MHKLLARQLRHHLGSADVPPSDWERFVEAVSDAYDQADGDRALLERSLELASQELLDRHRRLEADVAERERAEKEIERSLSLLRATLDSTRDGILVVDRDDVIVEFNERLLDMWGMDAELIGGRSAAVATAYVASQIGDPFLARLYGPGATEEATDDVLELADGRIFERHSQPQWIASERVGRVWSFRDVTAERRRAEEALRQSEEQLRQAQKMEAIGQLAGGVAHDFNNLLTAINGFSELVLGRMDESDERRPLVAEIAKAGERASALTSQLLAFGRRQVLQPEVLNLSTVVADMEKLLRRVIGEDVEFMTQVDPDLGNVRADPGQIGQVLLNLATNARDAMPRGGRITIEASNTTLQAGETAGHRTLQPGPYVVLNVRDTGRGIDPSILPHIFEPFFTTKEVGRGTGLGLSTVYGIVKQSGGELDVSSVPGEGTTFSIYLPRYDEEPISAKDHAQPSPVPVGRETLLLAEDEDPVRELVTAVLEASGHTVLAASRGEEAVRICQEFPGRIHLLLTDVVMPGMSGLELSNRVLGLRPEMHVLYMSGHTNDVTLRHGIETANRAFLQKPFSPAGLVLKVREVLDGPAPSSARGD